MCSGAGSGAAGSAGGAVDAGYLDPMLDRLFAVEVAGLPDSALAADLVGLRVAVSRLEPEFARRLLAHDRRHLSVSATFAGTVVLDGVLDPEGGATVIAALAPLAAPGGADDDRTPAQRRADALVELARRALDGAGLPSVGV